MRKQPQKGYVSYPTSLNISKIELLDFPHKTCLFSFSSQFLGVASGFSLLPCLKFRPSDNCISPSCRHISTQITRHYRPCHQPCGHRLAPVCLQITLSWFPPSALVPLLQLIPHTATTVICRSVNYDLLLFDSKLTLLNPSVILTRKSPMANKSTPDLGLVTSSTLLCCIFFLICLTPCSLASFAGPWHCCSLLLNPFPQIVIYGALLWAIHTSVKMLTSAKQPAQFIVIQLGSR